MDTASELLRMIQGYRISQAIHVAAELQLSDHLVAGPRTVAELAEATGCHQDALYRLIRALASVGLYRKLPDGRFESTALGDELRADAPRGLRGFATFMGRAYHWQAWSALGQSVRTGENAFSLLHGQSVWEYRSQRPEETEIFDAAMTALSRYQQTALIEAYDFSGFGTVADIGGGRGALLTALLNGYPQMEGWLFDQPHVVAGASDLLEGAGVADRCRIVGGDFFQGVPQGADALLLKAILHDWEDDETIAILRRCREAMRPDSVLLILERVVGDPPTPQETFSDLSMMVGPGGRERTGAEFAAVLSKADLELTRIVPTTSELSVIEARPKPGS